MRVHSSVCKHKNIYICNVCANGSVHVGFAQILRCVLVLPCVCSMSMQRADLDDK